VREAKGRFGGIAEVEKRWVSRIVERETEKDNLMLA